MPGFLGGRLQFVLALAVEKTMRQVIVLFGDQYLCGPVQIAVIGFVWFNKLLLCGNAVLLKHYHQHLGVDDRPGVEEFHWRNLPPKSQTAKTVQSATSIRELGENPGARGARTLSTLKL